MRLSDHSALPAAVIRPGYARERVKPRMAHIGFGAFHRAHQATHTDQAMAAGDRDWAITGVGVMPHDRRSVETLNAFIAANTTDAKEA